MLMFGKEGLRVKPGVMALFVAALLAVFVLVTLPVHASGTTIPPFAAAYASPSMEGLGEQLTEAQLADIVGRGSILGGLKKVIDFVLDVYDTFVNPERVVPIRL